MSKIPGFKAYDIRGKVPSELNEEIAYKVGRAFVTQQNAKKVLIGRDVRESSPLLAKALANGLTDAGADVIDLDELKYGVRREGIFGAIYWYMVKFGFDIAGGAPAEVLHSGLIVNHHIVVLLAQPIHNNP